MVFALAVRVKLTTNTMHHHQLLHWVNHCRTVFLRYEITLQELCSLIWKTSCCKYWWCIGLAWIAQDIVRGTQAQAARGIQRHEQETWLIINPDIARTFCKRINAHNVWTHNMLLHTSYIKHRWKHCVIYKMHTCCSQCLGFSKLTCDSKQSK